MALLTALAAVRLACCSTNWAILCGHGRTASRSASITLFCLAVSPGGAGMQHGLSALQVAPPVPLSGLWCWPWFLLLGSHSVSHALGPMAGEVVQQLGVL